MDKEKSRLGIIHWLRPGEGGRRQPISSGTYYPTTVLPADLLAEGSSVHWSLKIELEEGSVMDPYVAFCTLSFLFPHAPHHVLDQLPGLDIYEGPHLVATVVFER